MAKISWKPKTGEDGLLPSEIQMKIDVTRSNLDTDFMNFCQRNGIPHTMSKEYTDIMNGEGN